MEDTVITLINSVGFPAAICICLIIYLYKISKSHAEEIAKLAEIIDTSLTNNTNAIKELTSSIIKGGDKFDNG